MMRPPIVTQTPHLSTRALTKKFGAFTAVDHVDLDFAPGRISAVLGENGAGKSTLMKLLFGLHAPTAGEILIDGRPVVWRNAMSAIEAGLGMVQQHFSLVDSLSVIDNIMLGDEVCTRDGRLKREEAIARLTKLLPTAQLAVPWHSLVGDLGVGQKQKVEILKLLFREAKILFLDEPTAVLTPHEIREFFDILRMMKANGKTVVLITHKIDEVLDVCDDYVILRQGRLTASGHVKDATGASIVEAMIGRRLEQLSQVRPPALEACVLRASGVQDVTVAAGASGLKNVSLHIQAGEIVGIAGVEGAGQQALVDVIMGLRESSGDLQVLGIEPRLGETDRLRRAGVALVPEDRHSQGLWLDESCHTNMVIGIEDEFVSMTVLQDAKIKAVTADWAREFDVRAASLEVPVGSLSGGNQQKIIFAREVSGRKPKLLICYQPTRGVDLGAIDLIHRKILELRNQGLGVLLISSEIDELVQLSDRIVVLLKGEVSAEFERSQFDRLAIGAAMTGAGRTSTSATKGSGAATGSSAVRVESGSGE